MANPGENGIAKRRWRPTRRVVILYIQVVLVLVLVGSQLVQVTTRNTAFLLLTRVLVQPQFADDATRYQHLEKLFDRLAQTDGDRFDSFANRVRRLSETGAGQNSRMMGRNALLAGRQAESVGDNDSASAQYHAALEANDEQIQWEARLRLEALLRRRGDEMGAQALRSGVLIDPPDFATRAEWGDIRLRGGFIDVDDIATGRPVHVLLVWEKDTMSDSTVDEYFDLSRQSQWETFVWDDTIFLLGQTSNLIQDGGFQHTAQERRGLPSGFSGLYRSHSLDDTGLVFDTESQPDNMVLELYGQGERSVGVTSSAIDVTTSDACMGYLLSGNYRSTPNSDPRIGFRWLGSATGGRDADVSEIVVRRPSEEWRSFAQLGIPSDNVGRAQYWVIETVSSAHLFVDNLALLPIPIPCHER